MRRFIGVALVASSLVVSACSGSQGSVPKPAAPKEKVTIRWIAPEKPEDFQFAELKKLFEERNPDITVEYIYTPDKAEDKLRAMMSAGDPPDISKVNDDYMTAYAIRDLATPLDDLMKKHGVKDGDSSFYPFFWTWPKVNGKHYAWPIGYASRAFYINIDLFEKAGVPLPPKEWGDPSWTWDKMLEVAKKLTKDTNGDGKPDQWGVSIFHTTAAEETFARTAGGTGIYSPDGRSFTLGEGKNLEAMKWLQELATVHKVHPLKSEFSQQKAQDMFAAGKIAMLYLDSRYTSRFRTQIGDKFKFALRPLPMKEAPKVEVSVDSEIIPKGAKHPDEAFRFLKFLTEEDAQKIMAEAGFDTPVRPAYTEKYFVAKGKMPLDQEVFVQGMAKYAVGGARTTNTEQARNVYRKEMEQVWNGKADPAEVLAKAKPEVDKLLKEFPDVKF